MQVDLRYAHGGLLDLDAEQGTVGAPGQFERTLDAAWSRIPAIGEAVRLGPAFVGHVTWVLWPLNSEPVIIDLELHPGYSAPTRAALIASGWVETD